MPENGNSEAASDFPEQIDEPQIFRNLTSGINERWLFAATVRGRRARKEGLVGAIVISGTVTAAPLTNVC